MLKKFSCLFFQAPETSGNDLLKISVYWTYTFYSSFLSFFSDPVWQGDPSLGQPPGLLQLLRAIPPELPAQRVADPSCLTVQCEPGAPRRRRRRTGGGRGRSRHSFPGFHVTVLAFFVLQPVLLLASSFPPPAPQVEAVWPAGKRGAGLALAAR